MKAYNSEENLQIAVVDYISKRYPDVLVRTDGGGIKLTKGQAIKLSRMNGRVRGFPDLFIYRGGGNLKHPYAGLAIELKREGVKLTKKNGEWATSHIEEQALILQKLRKEGYFATFAVGFDEAKNIIDQYLAGEAE